MKVLYVITKANWGGAQRYVYDLALAAKERGHEAAVAYGEPGLLVDRLHEKQIATYQVKGLQRDVSPLKEFAAKRELVRLFKTLHPDVVHLNSSKAGYTGAIAARAAGIKKIIFTAHGWAFNEVRNPLSKLVFAYLQRQTAKKSTYVIAVSDAVANRVRHWNLPNLERIPLGVAPFSGLSKEEARAALIQRDPTLEAVRHERWVGTIAELHKNKGLDIGIAAWKSLPSHTPKAAWIIIGDGEEKERLAHRARGIFTIHFLGFMPDAAQYLKAFDLFMLPSRTEALGYVILEAGMAGVPVVASSAGGIPEATGYPVGALSRVGDARSLSDLLSGYLRDPQSLTRTGETLNLYVARKFSLENMIDKTFALYAR